jgi:uncharacterized protein
VFEIGVNPAMHRRMLDLAKLRDARETQLIDVGKLLTMAEQQPGKLPEATLDKARQTAASLNAAIAELREQAELLNRQVGLAMSARVIAQQKLFEGVDVLPRAQRVWPLRHWPGPQGHTGPDRHR